MYIVVGLGNPGKEYVNTRHNVGRIAADFVEKEVKNVKIVTPDTYMNKSGPAVAKAMAGKSAKNLIIIHDDLDLPLGGIKISYGRGAGGHKGVESIIKTLKTKEFIRIRVGIAPKRKPKGEKEVENFILSEFKKPEVDTLNKVYKRVAMAVSVIIEDDLQHAQTQFNS
jgi:peptidyl-tRNA hydrolase, PTH1 family